MDSGVAALIGSAIGSMSGVITVVLNDYLRRRRHNRLRKIRQDTLRKVFTNSKSKWRSLETLSDSIGADEDTTVTLLLETAVAR
jgi:hypothetical protein